MMLNEMWGMNCLWDIPDPLIPGVAEKSRIWATVFGIFLGPIGYFYVGSVEWAIACFLTGNFLLLGPLIVPLHANKKITEAREWSEHNDPMPVEDWGVY